MATPVGCHTVRKQVDPEPRRLQAEAVFNPELAVIEVLSRQRIVTQQKATPRRAIHDMHDGNFMGRKHDAPIWPSHCSILLQGCETMLREHRM
ncbi:MAG: hypothetical protein KDA96_10635, partial [Planctomycetaceae bacterium]|nr:hypothetical protein [Planctomycetaceae bacterium]